MDNFDYLADLPIINRYNARRGPTSPTRVRVHMGPAPYDGNPAEAKVLLLMNNPGFDDTSTPVDHQLSFDGWPLAGLHPSAPESLRVWYQRPLGYLISAYGAQFVSQRVALLQMMPWASAKFDPNLVLPSREHLMEVARSAAKRGALVVIGRSFNDWGGALVGFHKVHQVKNRLNPTLSPGGVSAECWSQIRAAMGPAD